MQRWKSPIMQDIRLTRLMHWTIPRTGFVTVDNFRLPASYIHSTNRMILG